jgi:hypothetical protein
MGQILQSQTISKNEINGSVNVIDDIYLDLTCENNRIINQYLKSTSKKKLLNLINTLNIEMDNLPRIKNSKYITNKTLIYAIKNQINTLTNNELIDNIVNEIIDENNNKKEILKKQRVEKKLKNEYKEKKEAIKIKEEYNKYEYSSSDSTSDYELDNVKKYHTRYKSQHNINTSIVQDISRRILINQDISNNQYSPYSSPRYNSSDYIIDSETGEYVEKDPYDYPGVPWDDDDWGNDDQSK